MEIMCINNDIEIHRCMGFVIIVLPIGQQNLDKLGFDKIESIY